MVVLPGQLASVAVLTFVSYREASFTNVASVVPVSHSPTIAADSFARRGTRQIAFPIGARARKAVVAPPRQFACEPQTFDVHSIPTGGAHPVAADRSFRRYRAVQSLYSTRPVGCEADST